MNSATRVGQLPEPKATFAWMGDDSTVSGKRELGAHPLLLEADPSWAAVGGGDSGHCAFYGALGDSSTAGEGRLGG